MNSHSSVKYQIFISSTFEDLKEERRVITETILSMGHIPVGMELFEAGNTDQWSYIKDRIDEIDYYLVIVAESYGSIGPGGISYTQMEYEYAMGRGVPLAAFLLEDGARKTWPSAKVDFANKPKLEEFRKLCQKKMVTSWTDCGTLASKCQLALNRLFKHSPRTGWIPGDQGVPASALAELARLSEENARIRAQVQELSKISEEHSKIEACMRVLESPISEYFEKHLPALRTEKHKICGSSSWVRCNQPVVGRADTIRLTG